MGGRAERQASQQRDCMPPRARKGWRVAGWTFLTNHAQVLLCLARRDGERLTAREIAAQAGITERAVQRILDDLEVEGYISRRRAGRTNRYEVHGDLPMRHPAQRGRIVRDLLDLLALSEH